MRKALAGLSAAILLIVGVVACLVACVPLLRIHRALREARGTVAAEGNVPFDLVTWRRDAGAGFETVRGPNRFVAGAAVGGELYLAGPGGLAVYGGQAGMEGGAGYEAGGGGAGLARTALLETGIDLPAAPIVSLAVGRLRGEGSVHLIAGTKGEGVLLFPEGGRGVVRQLRARDGTDKGAARDVTAVLALESGDLLIGTGCAGLLVYDGQSLKVFGPEFAGLHVTALAGDEGDFWVGTRDRGVLHWHAGQMETFGGGLAGGLPDPLVEDIAMGAAGAGAGEVFVGTPLGIGVFRGGKPERVLGRGLFAHRLALDGDTLLVGTADQGVREIGLGREGGSGSAEMAGRLEESLDGAGFFPASGSLLALSDSRVLRHEGGGAWSTVLSVGGEGLADRNVTSLTFGADGRLWVGYFDHGIDVVGLGSGGVGSGGVGSGRAVRAEHVEDDHVFCVNRIVRDPLRQTMDVATANGLVLLDAAKAQPAVRQVLSRRDGLISDQVSDVAFTRNGMAVATPAGLTFFTPTGVQSLYAFEGLVNNHVYTLAADQDSRRVIAGTLGGISILDDGGGGGDVGVRRNLTLKNSGLKRNWITAVVRVPDGGSAGEDQERWFVGTYGGGVVAMDAAGRVTELEGALRTAVINPNAILRTGEHVFAGSLGDGLLVYSLGTDGGLGRWSAMTAGLPSRNVTALAESGGMLYVGTDNGIVRIAEARLR